MAIVVGVNSLARPGATHARCVDARCVVASSTLKRRLPSPIALVCFLFESMALAKLKMESTVIVVSNVRGITREMRRRQGGRSWLAFGDRCRIPQSFRRARICKFSGQKFRFFLQLVESRPFVVVKRLTHTQARSLKHPF